MFDTPPSLAWVLVDGVPRHVSEFAQMPPRSRPAARCPQCGRRLTLKLGAIRRHHAAHAPGWICPATRAETALHIDCKLALAAALRTANGRNAVLSIVERCAGVDDEACVERRVTTWLRGWDDVTVEARVGNAMRPDIVLDSDGVPVAAIEIVASNPVSADKARMLEAMNVPWIEVAASEALASPDAWSIADPLEVVRTSHGDAWRCSMHAAQYRMQVAAAEARHSAEREAERHVSVLRAARVIDVYHDGGARERFIYRVTESLTDGTLESIRLQRGGVVVATIPVESRDDLRSQAWPLVRDAVAADLERFARGPGSFTDSPMRWARGDAAENIVGESLTDYAGRDPTPLATRYPRRWFWAPDRGRWFLPADMREVRWDREPLDPFAAHPAWTRQRGAVRERPAPEGSWETPVFASPPIAAMFRDCVRRVDRLANDAIGLVEVASAANAEASRRRIIVVIEREVADELAETVRTTLAPEDADVVWLSHPRHWTASLAQCTWAPAGRDWRGRGGVVIDGLGVYTADQFARAWAKRDPRLEPEAVRQRMTPRVERLAYSSQSSSNASSSSPTASGGK